MTDPAGDPGGTRFKKPGADTGVRFDKPGGPAHPPQFDQPVPVLAPEPGPTYDLASWGRRAAAAVIDGVIVFVLIAAIGGGLSAAILSARPLNWGLDSGESGAEDFVQLLWVFLAVLFAGLVVSLTYAPIWMSRTNGRTLGKQMLGIRVVRADGSRMTFAFAVFREFLVKGLLGAVASSFSLYLYALADVLWPLWDSERRAIHDHIASTRVVRD